MIKPKTSFFKLKALLLSSVVLFTIACNNTTKPVLTIATSANMQYPIKEICELFHQETGIEYRLVTSSSGKLCTQILSGAPYHLFISADTLYPNKIHKQGFSVEKPTIYAQGKLVLWTMDTIVPTIKNLKSARTKHIAIANPKTAPYGFAAFEFIKNVDSINIIKNKIVYAESISQVNQFTTSKNVEFGITSISSVLSNTLKDKGEWININSNHYSPLLQAMVLLKNKELKKESKLFYEFMQSNKVKKTLNNYGFSTTYK